MTNNLKIEVLVSNIPEDGSIASQFPSQEYVNQQLAKKANLSPEGRLDPSHAPDYTEIPGLYEHIEDTKDEIGSSIADSLQDAKGYTNQQLSEGLRTKADLVNGKIPFDQIPFSADIEDQIQINVENITAVVDQKVAQVVGQVNEAATAANVYTDTKVAENKAYVDNTIGNVIEDVTTIVDTKTVSKEFTIPTYMTPEAGVAAGTGVAAGAYFNVHSTNEEELLVEYQNVGGSATPTGKSYPSGNAKWSTTSIYDASGKNQQEINSGILRSALATLSSQPGDSIVIRGHGGGRFEYTKESLSPDDVVVFSGLNGFWRRIGWKHPDVYDADIKADGTDETLKFKALVKAVSTVLGGGTISLRGKAVKITDFEIPSNITIYNGVLDFSESTTILADNKYYNGFIIGGNRASRAIDPNDEDAYLASPRLKNVGFVKVGFKAPPSGTYGFSTDFIYLTNVEGFTFKHCYGKDTNSNRLFTIVGGRNGSAASDEIPVFDTVDPKNGWSSGVSVKYNKFNAGKEFGLNSSGSRLIVPSMRLTACEDIDISSNNFKNFNIPILIDAYCRNGDAYNNTCSIDDDVLDVWLSGVTKTDQIGAYIGQSAYGVNIYNNRFHNFIYKAVYVEAASDFNVYSNISRVSDYGKSLAASQSISYGIHLNPNIRQHPYSSIGGVHRGMIYSNIIEGCKSPFIMSSALTDSLRDIDCFKNTFDSIGSNHAMQINRCYNSRFTDNTCAGGMTVGEVRDSNIDRNTVDTPSNYALLLTGGAKSNNTFRENSFVVGVGQVIRNQTASGSVHEFFGGKLQSKDSSATLRNDSGVGLVRAYDFENGVAPRFKAISPPSSISIPAGGSILLEDTIAGLKLGWTAIASLSGMATLFTNNGINLDINVGVNANKVSFILTNKGASPVSFTPTLLTRFNSYMDNTFTN